METIKVVAAIIRHNNMILATQRGYGDFKDGWEFPGGKIELGETPERALVREIEEELNVKIEVGELAEVIKYDYPKFHLVMYCYFCTLCSKELVLKEHKAAKWITKKTLDSVAWLAADEKLILKIKDRIFDFLLT